MQVSHTKHKTKDAHSIHCMRSEKNLHRHSCHALLLRISSSLQDKSRKTYCKGLEQNTGLGFHSNTKPCFVHYKMEEKKTSSEAMVLIKWLKILRTAC